MFGNLVGLLGRCAALAAWHVPQYLALPSSHTAELCPFVSPKLQVQMSISSV